MFFIWMDSIYIWMCSIRVCFSFKLCGGLCCLYMYSLDATIYSFVVVG
jgi:hypothetical protein